MHTTLTPPAPDQARTRVRYTADTDDLTATLDALLADDARPAPSWTAGPHAAIAWGRQLVGGAR